MGNRVASTDPLSAALYQSLIDNLPQPILLIDRSFQVIATNRAARNKYGTEQAPEATTCHALTHGSSVPCAHNCPVGAVFAQRQATRRVHRHLDCEGNATWVRVIASPIFDDSGDVRFVVEQTEDISKLQQSRQEVAALQEELDKVKVFLPMCASCKRVRDTDGTWTNVEEYLLDHTGQDVSHGICADCRDNLYGP